MRIGIDVGGTKANIALVGDDGQILRRQKLATGGEKPCRAVVAEMAGAVKELVAGEKIIFAGMGIPGTVDGKNVIHAPNLHWVNEPVGEYFFQETGIMPVLEQDTRAAAWGEARREEMRDKKCLACITLGTGIGCGIVLNHHIWRGAFGTSGEMGHIPVESGGRPCNCGRRGCMEAYASGGGMARIAAERGICQSTEALFDLAQAGDEAALQLIDEATGYGARAVAAMINLLAPDVVLFSGGLSNQKKLFVEPLMAKVRIWAYANAFGEGFVMDCARLGSDAPVIGAAFLDEA